MDTKNQTTQQAETGRGTNSFTQSQLEQTYIAKSRLPAGDPQVQSAARDVVHSLAQADAEGTLKALAKKHGMDADPLVQSEKRILEQQNALRNELEEIQRKQELAAKGAAISTRSQLITNAVVAAGTAGLAFLAANKFSQNKIVKGVAVAVGAVSGYLLNSSIATHKKQKPFVEQMNALTEARNGIIDQMHQLETEKCDKARDFVDALALKLMNDKYRQHPAEATPHQTAQHEAPQHQSTQHEAPAHHTSEKRNASTGTAQGEAEQLVESMPKETPDALKPQKVDSDISTPRDVQGHETTKNSEVSEERSPVGPHTAKEAKREAAPQHEAAIA